MLNPGCWVAEHVVLPGPCDGQLVKAHLIPKSLLKREYPFGAYVADGMADRIPARHRQNLAPNATSTLGGAIDVVTLDAIIWDPAVWVPVCGGPVGIGGHHGMLDHSRTLEIPRDALPPETETFAAVYGLTWFLEREYGPLELAA